MRSNHRVRRRPGDPPGTKRLNPHYGGRGNPKPKEAPEPARRDRKAGLKLTRTKGERRRGLVYGAAAKASRQSESAESCTTLVTSFTQKAFRADRAAWCGLCAPPS